MDPVGKNRNGKQCRPNVSGIAENDNITVPIGTSEIVRTVFDRLDPDAVSDGLKSDQGAKASDVTEASVAYNMQSPVFPSIVSIPFSGTEEGNNRTDWKMGRTRIRCTASASGSGRT